MRNYSVRERIGSGVLALIFLSGAALVSIILATRADMRTLGTWAGALGGWGGVVLFCKIAFTGSSWEFFELNVGTPDSAREPKANSTRDDTHRNGPFDGGAV